MTASLISIARYNKSGAANPQTQSITVDAACKSLILFTMTVNANISYDALTLGGVTLPYLGPGGNVSDAGMVNMNGLESGVPTGVQTLSISQEAPVLTDEQVWYVAQFGGNAPYFLDYGTNGSNNGSPNVPFFATTETVISIAGIIAEIANPANLSPDAPLIAGQSYAHAGGVACSRCDATLAMVGPEVLTWTAADAAYANVAVRVADIADIGEPETAFQSGAFQNDAFQVLASNIASLGEAVASWLRRRRDR